MRTYGDHRGIALIFEDEHDLDTAIDRMQRMRTAKRENPTPYPAVYIYTDERMPDDEARRFHDQVWFMHYTTVHAPRKDSTAAPRSDN